MTTGTGVAQLPTFANNMMPALPQEMRAVFGQFFAPAMDTFGSNFNRISLKGNRIRMIVGGQEVRVEPDALDFVILGVSPEQYCVWYSKNMMARKALSRTQCGHRTNSHRRTSPLPR